MTADAAGELLFRDILQALETNEPTVVKYPAGTGKAQPHSEPVLLARGWVPMGDVVVGDRVYGSDGKLHRVMAVHPQGVRRVYRLEFSDGSWARCDEDHLWTLRNHNGTWRTRTAKDWAALPLTKLSGAHNKNTLFAPELAAIQRPEADQPLDAYTLGLLLGDGGMSSHAVAFTSMDQELHDALLLPVGVRKVRSDSTSEVRAWTCRLVYGRGNPLIRVLKDLGLQGCDSWTKHIPKLYLRGSINQRLALLQGLFDTDGHCLVSGGVEYCTASTEMALQVQDMVEGLGGTCTLVEKHVEIEPGRVHTYQRAHVRLPWHMCPFRLQRKVATWSGASRQRGITRAVVAIRRDGEEVCSCITVDAPDHLYVTRRHLLTHNSYQSARAIAAQVAKGHRVCYATQEHAVAHATKRLLPAELQARAVHIHSPLIQVGDDPVCQRRDELLERVFEYGQALQGRVCPRCPHRFTCPALAAAKDRAQRLPNAAIVFVSHAGISQVIGHTPDGTPKGQDFKLIVDEMPGAYKEIHAPADAIRQIADGAPMTSAAASSAKLAQEIARAWLAGERPGDVAWGFGGAVLGNAVELAQEWGRLALRDHVRPPAVERPLLRAADALIRLCAHHADGGGVLGLDTRCDDGVRAMLPDQCHEALVARRGVLLSATPLMQALPGFRLLEQEVKDGAKVRRVLVLRDGRGSRALTQAYYDDATGARVVCPDMRDAPGVPWELVDEALARARQEAAKYDCKRILFVTFKPLADALRSALGHGRLRDDVVVAHFGALRGKNDWMEGSADECSVVYCFGTPRFNMLPTIWQLGLLGEAADQAWVAFAAGELAQAEGRLRLPRRTKPCTVIVEGDVAPSTWYPNILDDVVELPLEDRPAAALLAAALEYRDLAELAREGVDAGTDPGRVPPPLDNNLESLALPDIRDGVAALAAMSPGRRRRLEQEFTWAPQD